MNELTTQGPRRSTRSNFEHASKSDMAIAERFGRQISLELLGRNRLAAISVLDQALAALDPPVTSEFYKQSLTGILELKTTNALDNYHGARTIAEVLEIEDNVLLTTPNFGPRGLIELHKAISRSAIKHMDFLEATLRRTGWSDGPAKN